jgi:hypothetical protein
VSVQHTKYTFLVTVLEPLLLIVSSINNGTGVVLIATDGAAHNIVSDVALDKADKK